MGYDVIVRILVAKPAFLRSAWYWQNINHSCCSKGTFLVSVTIEFFLLIGVSVIWNVLLISLECFIDFSLYIMFYISKHVLDSSGVLLRLVVFVQVT